MQQWCMYYRLTLNWRLSRLTRLFQLKRSLEEALDAEILDLVEEEDALAEEIQQADDFNEGALPLIIKIKNVSADSGR